MEEISIESLINFIGAEKDDVDTYEIVEMLKKSAKDNLLAVTGESVFIPQNQSLVNEYLTCSVYLSFYASRGADIKTEYIERRRRDLIQLLKLSGGA